ncbi:MAG: hypothetical protein K6V73_04200 [Firmicutes bacterium]|nr:hypothetical protein [Bacillota bacterium]
MIPARAAAGMGTLLAVALAAAGCGDAHPIESRAIVLAVGADAGRGGELVWTFIFPNVTASASSITNLTPATQVYSTHVRAADFASAVEAVQDRLSRQPYLGDLQVLVLGLSLPAQRARAVVADLQQQALVPSNFLVAASPSPTGHLLTLPTAQEIVPRYFLTTFLACHWCRAFDWRMPAWEWWSRSESPGAAPVAPVLVAEDGDVVNTGVAVYPSAGPVLVMPPDAGAGLAYLTSRVTRDSFSFSSEGTTYTVTRVTARTRCSCRLTGDGLVADVAVRVHGQLAAMVSENSTAAAVRARMLVSRYVLERVLAALAWANAHRVDPADLTEKAILRAPRLTYALAPGSEYFRPIAARVRVATVVETAGISR